MNYGAGRVIPPGVIQAGPSRKPARKAQHGP